MCAHECFGQIVWFQCSLQQYYTLVEIAKASSSSSHTGANVHLARIKPDIVCMRVYKLCMYIYWFGRHTFGCVRVRPTCPYSGKINSIISSSALTARTAQSSVPITRVHQAIHDIMPSCLCYNRDHYTQNIRMLDKLSPPVNWCWCANRMLCGWDEIVSGLGVQCVNMFCCVRFVAVCRPCE